MPTGRDTLGGILRCGLVGLVLGFPSSASAEATDDTPRDVAG